MVTSFLAGQSPTTAQEFHARFYDLSGVSDRDLLGLGAPEQRLKALAKNIVSTNDQPDTLRILALRVDFQEDNNSLTTGNGKFDLTFSSEATIDPPPHDRSYFEEQLTALANYFEKVSHGNLILEAEVYPKGVDDTFTLSNPMSFYSPVEEDLLDQRLSELFQEGFQIADATRTIDFSQFDSFILFHAGVGGDFALDFDPTPQDIPSVFLDFQTLRTELGDADPTYRGIAVNDGDAFVRDGIILPETQSQEGFEIGLLGTIAIQFGHQIGLPNLFDTNTGRPGIGVFGLMDQGSGNFIGLLPSEPCAWSKVFLGWQTPVEVRNGEKLLVAAPQASGENKIYKIPIDSREYFLIENRNRDLENDQVAIGSDAKGTRVEFRWDEQGQRLIADGPLGVITEVNEYDFGLPGSGILIWHIDERVIAANFEANLVNGNPNRRGVDLEEADGAQDIGQVYGFLSPGAGSENGVIEDMFWGSNPINMLVNDSSDVVEFTPTTTPNSLSNSGANTQIFITDFSEPGENMTFTVREQISLNGFPQFVGATGILTNSPTLADLNQDGRQEIIWSSNANTNVLVWNSDGTKFIPNEDSAQLKEFNGRDKTVPLSIFAEAQGTVTFSPAVVPLNGQQSAVVIATDEAVTVFAPTDNDLDGRADLFFTSTPSTSPSTSPLVMSTNPARIVVGTQGGDVLAITLENLTTAIPTSAGPLSGLSVFSPDEIAFSSSTGNVGVVSLAGNNVTWQNSTGSPVATAPVVADFDRNGRVEVAVLTDSGELVVFTDSGELSPGFPKSTGVEEPSHLALGDVDGDGFLDFLFTAGPELAAFNHVGLVTDNFPIRLVSDASESQSSPILADLNGDSVPETIVGTAAGQLVAYDENGRLRSDFPLATGASVNSTPAVSDIDDDGDLDLVAVSDDGFLYAWDLGSAAAPESIPWGGFLRDSRHSNSDLQITTPPSPGAKLLQPNLVYNYPNPTEGNRTTIRYSLNSEAEVQIKIYDLAGELVDELVGSGFGQAENEVNWQLDNIESGVYLARVEARADTDTDVVIFKIAVVK